MVVGVLNVVDACIPSDLEERRLLLYVAMMRAKKQLHLIVSQRFFTYTGSAASATTTSTRGARASFRTQR